MQIAQLTYGHFPVVGGADAYAEALRRLLTATGHHVVSYQRHTGTDQPSARQLPPIPWPLCRRDFWVLPYLLRLYRRELREFDVLLGHYPQYCREALDHPRVVGLSHGVTWDEAPDSRLGRHKRQWAKWAFDHCARYVANDTFFLREMGLDVPPGAEGFREVAPNRWYLPNCVDERVFHPHEPDLESPAHQSILVPRNIYYNRGVDLAIAAFATIADRLPRARLVVAGAASQGFAMEAAEAAARKGGVTDRVTFLGSVPWTEMPALYSAARVTVIPSRCGEGTSLAALESMACGTAVVATEVGGLPDVPALHASVDPKDLGAKLLVAWETADELAAQQREAALTRHARSRWEACWLHILTEWP